MSVVALSHSRMDTYLGGGRRQHYFNPDFRCLSLQTSSLAMRTEDLAANYENFEPGLYNIGNDTYMVGPLIPS